MLGHPYTNQCARSPRITPLDSITKRGVCTGWPGVGWPSGESGHAWILAIWHEVALKTWPSGRNPSN